MAWRPDGQEILFNVWFPDREEFGLYRVPSDGSKEAELIDHSSLNHVSASDDARIVVRTTGSDRLVRSSRDQVDYWLLPIDDPGPGRMLLSSAPNMRIRSVSPDAQHVLFELFGDDRMTVYLARYPEFDRRMQVSLDHSARNSFFSADGSTIYYRAEGTPADRLFEVSFDPNGSTMLGRPQPLFELPQGSSEVALGPGGEGFLVTMRERTDDSGVADTRRGIRVVENWTRKIEGLRA